MLTRLTDIYYWWITDDPLVVVTIAPDGDDDYNCTFVGAEGYVTHLGPVQDVDGPQAQVSVTCAAVE